MSKKSTIVNVKEFSTNLATMERPGPRAKARLFCSRCNRNHNLHWGEMQNSITKHGATTLQTMIDAYAEKYCDEIKDQKQQEKEEKLEVYAKEFTELLENMHDEVYVIDIISHNYNCFSIKIQTPIATYFDTGDKRSWIELVNKDIAAAENFHCPFCNSEINSEDYNEECGCGAVCSSSASELEHTLQFDQWTKSEVATALNCFDELFIQDSDHHVVWGKKPESSCSFANLLEQITGPDDSIDCHSHPILHDQEYDDPDNTEAYQKTKTVEQLEEIVKIQDEPLLRPATCEYCQHCVKLQDNSNVISGLEDSCMYSQDCSICVYPLQEEKFREQWGQYPNDEFELKATKIRGYREDEMAKIWNSLMQYILEDLCEVEEASRSLEAFATAPFHKFFGPICRNFKLNKEHYSLNGYPYNVLPLEINVRFGLINLAREKEERAEELKKQEKIKLHKETEKILRELKNQDKYQSIMNIRIEKKTIKQDGTIQLLSFLKNNLPIEAQLNEQLFCEFSWAFNVSNSVAYPLGKQMVAEVKIQIDKEKNK